MLISQMKNAYWSFLFVLGVVFVFSLRTASAQGVYDKGFFVGRAYELASFGDDERAVEPEIKIFLPGIKSDVLEEGGRTKVINILDPTVNFGGVRAIFRAPSYIISDAGRKREVFSFKRGVKGILDEAGVELAKEDRVDPPTSASSQNINLIKITRVEETEIEKFETLPYQTKEIDDPNLERGLKKVSQDGKNGKKRLLYLVRRENGVEVSRTKKTEEIVEKPVDKIIRNGTKVVVLSSVKGYATIYNPSKCSVVSVNYRRGTLVRITNQANGVSVLKDVDCTWGTAIHPPDVVLDLSRSVLSELKYNGSGKGAYVLVEEIKR